MFQAAGGSLFVPVVGEGVALGITLGYIAKKTVKLTDTIPAALRASDDALKHVDDVVEAATKRQTIVERGEELALRNRNKNSVAIITPDGKIRVDLRGKAHSSKELGNVSVPTPHAQAYKNNVIPKGPRKGQVGSITKDGDVIPGDASMLRMVDRYLKSKGQ